MATSKLPLLTALMAPHAAEEFLDRFWPRQAIAVHGDPMRFPAPLRHEALASSTALAQRYRGNLRFTHGRSCQQMVEIDRVHPAILQEMGLTLQFDDITPYVPGMHEFLRQLEAELDVHEGSASVSAFASPREDGLPCHYDAKDLFSIQLTGTKRFHYAPMREIANPYGTQYVPNTRPFDDLYPQAGNGFPDFHGVDFETAAMKPGSVLYVPRGTWHYTEAGDDSLSLSVVINPPVALECLLDQLRLLLMQDSGWRRPMYGARSREQRREVARNETAALLARLPSMIARLGADDLLHALRPPEARLESIDAQTRFQKAPDATVEFDAAPSRNGLPVVEIRIGHTSGQRVVAARLEIFPEARPVFSWLGDRTHPFSAGALHAAFPAFPFSEIKNILTAGTQTQLLKPLWFAPLDASH